MDQDQIKNLIETALRNMIAKDAASNPTRDLLNTAERNITAQLREHLALVFPKAGELNYQVDHEYNRVGFEAEQPKFSVFLNQNVIPDIAVHLRGVRRNENPEANLLVIEAKKIPSFDGSLESIGVRAQRDDLEDDLHKLEALQNLDDQYGYLHAASVVFAKNTVWIKLDAADFEPVKLEVK